ncbi:Bax inhibitor-1 family protein [Flavobacteriaceae bacterium]|nr:Bax inhibitor-1 family protein [Flavobacteriaceae bacterium]
MYDILFAKTFLIVGCMLVITTFFARINKVYETTSEAIINIAGTFILLFAIMYYDEVYPLNLVLVAIFSGFIGWSIGPTVSSLGESFKMRKYKKQYGLLSKTVVTDKKTISEKIFGQEDEKKTMFYEKSNPTELFDSDSEKYKLIIKKIISSNNFKRDNYHQEWQNVVFQAMTGTTIAVIATASIVFTSSFDFSILGGFLFIALIVLIIMGLLNVFIFKSKKYSLLRAYFGVLVFTGYLLYDFDMLEKQMNAGDESWSTAIKIAVNLYLDIINLFLDLLQILAESGGN